MAGLGARLLSAVSSSYYLKKVKEDSNTLHYKRSPTWRSLLILIGLCFIVYYVSSQSPYLYVRVFCYVAGFYFCYIATEKYEEVIFDKSKKTVSMMNSRFIEKHILGYRKKIVTELDNLVSVSVEAQKVSPGTGYMVVLLLLSGMTLSLTAQCTYGDKKEHEAIAKEIRKFLGKKSQQEESNMSDKPLRTKKND